jgi:starch phosphorylase
MRTLLEKTGYPVGEPDRPPLHDRPDKRAEYTGLDTISDEELTQAHRARKEALVAFASERLLRQYEKHGVSPEELEELAGLLNPDAFLIGFARRFTAYKRPALLWSYPKRLRKLLENSDRPVQIIFSGKAHPLDGEGQAMVAEMARLAESKRWRGKVFYLEEYDMAVGRHLTQGVDLWINNPLRPLEASGTSGMKAAMNGVPNASVLDGWWDEGYEGDNGWAVGARKPRKNRPRQDRFDATSLFDLLEDEILPMYGTPEWTQVMRRVIATSAWAFSTRRMLIDYVDSMIVPDPD